MEKRGQKIAENTIYYLIWLVVFAVTVIGYSEEGVIQWHLVGRFWLRTIPLFLLFLFNNYLLIPRLLLKKRYGLYTAVAVSSIAVLFVFYIFCFRALKPEGGPPYGTFRPEGNPPYREFRMPPGDTPGLRPTEADSLYREFRPGLPPRPFPVKWGPAFAMLIFSLVIVGFNVAIRLMFKTMNDSRVMEQLKRQNLRAELDYLKAQVNPHFFMNTLNNIHALVDIDTEKAKETIIELSKIMRYILYETDKTFVSLKDEVKFIRNYVSLMSIRYFGNVSIDAVYPQKLPEARIPPLLLITLVENAFKHGISYRQESYIRTMLKIRDGRLVYSVRNSLPGHQDGPKGMGLENMQKRLTLLYGNSYRLELKQDESEFTAVLQIPLEI